MVKAFPQTVASYRGFSSLQKADLEDVALPAPIEEKLAPFAAEYSDQERLFLRHLVKRLLLKDSGEQAKIVIKLHGTDKTTYGKMFPRAAEFMREMERSKLVEIDKEEEGDKPEVNSKPAEVTATTQSSAQLRNFTEQEERFITKLFTVQATSSQDEKAKITKDLYSEDPKLYSDMFNLVAEQIKNGVKDFAGMKATLG